MEQKKQLQKKPLKRPKRQMPQQMKMISLSAGARRSPGLKLRMPSKTACGL
jgi:hypothetical protein